MKKLMVLAAAASCLVSGLAFAQSDACVVDPTDPSCVCAAGENDADCVGGVHRGTVLGAAAETLVIHGLGSALVVGAGL
jgi:hypothetical protein